MGDTPANDDGPPKTRVLKPDELPRGRSLAADELAARYAGTGSDELKPGEPVTDGELQRFHRVLHLESKSGERVTRLTTGDLDAIADPMVVTPTGLADAMTVTPHNRQDRTPSHRAVIPADDQLSDAVDSLHAWNDWMHKKNQREIEARGGLKEVGQYNYYVEVLHDNVRYPNRDRFTKWDRGATDALQVARTSIEYASCSRNPEDQNLGKEQLSRTYQCIVQLWENPTKPGESQYMSHHDAMKLAEADYAAVQRAHAVVRGKRPAGRWTEEGERRSGRGDGEREV